MTDKTLDDRTEEFERKISLPEQSSSLILQQNNIHRLHLIQTLNTLKCLTLINYNYSDQYLLKSKVYLPPPSYAHSQVFRKKTLIFDLDETLIHCLDEKELEIGLRGEVQINVPYVDDDDESEGYVPAEINLRPHLIETLERLRQFF